jgi:hypothetical protein
VLKNTRAVVFRKSFYAVFYAAFQCLSYRRAGAGDARTAFAARARRRRSRSWR